MRRPLNALAAAALALAAGVAPARAATAYQPTPAGAQTEAAVRDEPGGPVKAVSYEVTESAPGGGAARRVRSATYDAKGNKVEETYFSSDGTSSQRFVYTFDAQGRPTGFEEYSGGLSVQDIFDFLTAYFAGCA